MRRRPRASRKLAKERSRKAPPPKRRTAPKLRRRSSPAAAQETELERRTRERDEALERETATSQVLRLISKSPGDLELVFRSILENATRICEAKFGVLHRFDGETFHLAAEVGSPPEYAEFQRQRGPFQPIQGRLLERVMLTKEVCHTADAAAEAVPSMAAKFAGARTQVVVPMLKEGNLIGAIIIYRQEVRPFTDKQIELVKNFAAQAVIAIENTRLLNELRESLQQQTATADVLKVISTSPGELEPVFQAMLENAVRICGAKFGNMLLLEGDVFRYVALHGAPAEFAAERQRDPIIHPKPGAILDRLLKTRQVVQVGDVLTEGGTDSSAIVTLAGARTTLMVPMLKHGDLIGGIAIYRQEVRPFTDKQIELLQNFAAQAVIAIENARLLNELHQRTDDLTESLEQQTATSEVLRVISSSPGELNPVFDAMLENAVRLCEAKFGVLFLYDGKEYRTAALHSASPAYAQARQRNTVVRHTHPDVPITRLTRTKDVIHIADVRTERCYIEDPTFSEVMDDAGARTVLVVPMLKEDELVGAFVIYRQEVREFADKQIELVKSFAAQAVIAIENTRLLNELRQRHRRSHRVTGAANSGLRGVKYHIKFAG